MSRVKKVHPRMFPDKPLCGGKRIYQSKLEAEAMKEEQELLNYNLELVVYRCNLGCKGWHLSRNLNHN